MFDPKHWQYVDKQDYYRDRVSWRTQARDGWALLVLLGVILLLWWRS